MLYCYECRVLRSNHAILWCVQLFCSVNVWIVLVGTAVSLDFLRRKYPTAWCNAAGCTAAGTSTTSCIAKTQWGLCPKSWWGAHLWPLITQGVQGLHYFTNITGNELITELSAKWIACFSLFKPMSTCGCNSLIYSIIFFFFSNEGWNAVLARNTYQFWYLKIIPHLIFYSWKKAKLLCWKLVYKTSQCFQRLLIFDHL